MEFLKRINKIFLLEPRREDMLPPKEKGTGYTVRSLFSSRVQDKVDNMTAAERQELGSLAEQNYLRDGSSEIG